MEGNLLLPWLPALGSHCLCSPAVTLTCLADTMQAMRRINGWVNGWGRELHRAKIRGKSYSNPRSYRVPGGDTLNPCALTTVAMFLVDAVLHHFLAICCCGTVPTDLSSSPHFSAELIISRALPLHPSLYGHPVPSWPIFHYCMYCKAATSPLGPSTCFSTQP